MSLYHDGLFGFDSVIFCDITTKVPVAMLRILNSMEFGRNRGSMVPLKGGSFPGAVALESGDPENPLALEVREYPNVAFAAFENANITDNAAEVSGNFGALTNSKGVSVFDATTGIASVAENVVNKNNIPFGRLVYVGVGADTVDIYAPAKLVGTGNFSDKLAKVASAVIIPGTGGTVDVPDLGITITGGSGSIAFVVDDAAYQDVRGVNNGNSIIEVGNINESLTEYLMFAFFPKMANGSFLYTEFHRVAMTSGIPIMGTYREWSTYTLEGEVLADTCNGGRLHTTYKVNPSISCS
jgi:hypothetical protein